MRTVTANVARKPDEKNCVIQSPAITDSTAGLDRYQSMRSGVQRNMPVCSLKPSLYIADRHTIIDLFAVASFSNTPHVIFQDAAFYQIGPACFFHDTLSPQPYL